MSMESYWKGSKHLLVDSVSDNPMFATSCLLLQCLITCGKQASCQSVYHKNTTCLGFSSQRIETSVVAKETDYVLFFRDVCREKGVYVRPGGCYIKKAKEETYSKALEICNDLGGYLLRVENEDEFELPFLVSINYNYMWVDGTKNARGQFEYSNGELPTTELWNQGQLSKPDQNCAVFKIISEYSWTYVSCNKHVLYLCERDDF